MDSIDTGLRLFVFIIVISLFFSLARLLVNRYLSDFFRGFTRLILKLLNSNKEQQLK